MTRHNRFRYRIFFESGRRDLNSRPPAPKASLGRVGLPDESRIVLQKPDSAFLSGCGFTAVAGMPIDRVAAEIGKSYCPTRRRLATVRSPHRLSATASWRRSP